MKTCSNCRETKSKSEFSPAKDHLDKLSSWCKRCRSKNQRERRRGIKRDRTYSMVNRISVNRTGSNGLERRCYVCHIWKPIEEFSDDKTSRGGKRHYGCKSCMNIRRQEAGNRLKNEVLLAYGGKCSCCKEPNFAFLTIDHINNDGNEHRKIVSGANLYRWLRRNNFPKVDFQILCWNCNMGKANNNGICPHKEV